MKEERFGSAMVVHRRGAHKATYADVERLLVEVRRFYREDGLGPGCSAVNYWANHQAAPCERIRSHVVSSPAMLLSVIKPRGLAHSPANRLVRRARRAFSADKTVATESSHACTAFGLDDEVGRC